MTKLKQPLLSLDARGSLADSISFTKRRGANIAEAKPRPVDRRTLAQMYQRWDYQDYIAWWHTLSAATKQTWQTAASRHHMTGFAYWMKDRLANLPNLVARWRMDEGGGSSVQDSSRNTNNGTAFGALPAAGLIGRSRLFDGLNDYIVVPHHASLNITDKITIHAFVRLTSLTVHRVVIGKFLNRYVIYFPSGGTTPFIILNLSTGQKVRSMGVAIGLNTWAHIGFTYDKDAGPNNLISYVGGDPANSFTETGAILTSGSALVIGASMTTFDSFPGNIDQLCLEDRTLTDADMLRHSLRRYP